MVGGDTGNVYKGRQGTGFATVFGRNEDFDKSLAALAKPDYSKFSDKTAKERPGDTWHYYNNELARAVDSKIKEGAALMTATGSKDLWSDISDPALKWRSDMGALGRAKSNIDQYKDAYDKAIGAIAVREEDYDPAYVEAVKNFPTTYDFSQLADGKIGFPVPKFTNPGDLYADLYTKDADAFQKSLKEGEVVSSDAVKERLNLYFNDPSKEKNLQAARQAFSNLEPKAQDKYKAIAEIQGFSEPWQAHAFTNYMNRITTKDVDLTSTAAKFGREAATKDYKKTNESGDVTEMTSSTALADPKYPDRQAKSYFYENAHLLDNPGAMSQLGVPMDIPREERRKRAEKAFSAIVRSNVETSYEKSRTTDEAGSGYGKEEIVANWDLWRQRIGSKDQAIANEAAGFVVGAKDPSGMGVVTNASVEYSGTPFKSKNGDIIYRGAKPGEAQRLVLEYSNEQAARTARDKYYKELILGLTPDDGESREDFAKRQTAYSTYLQELNQAGGKKVEIPLVDDKEQILKRVHDDAVQRTKSLYTPEIKRQADELGILKQGQTTFKDPAKLDE